MHFSISFHGKKFARKAVPGSLGVALDLADKASALRPEERIVPEDFHGLPRWDFFDGGCRYLGILHLNLPVRCFRKRNYRC